MTNTNHELTFDQLDHVSGGLNKAEAAAKHNGVAATEAKIDKERKAAVVNLVTATVAAGMAFGLGAAGGAS